jgi:hypothetical protein
MKATRSLKYSKQANRRLDLIKCESDIQNDFKDRVHKNHTIKIDSSESLIQLLSAFPDCKDEEGNMMIKLKLSDSTNINLNMNINQI